MDLTKLIEIGTKISTPMTLAGVAGVILFGAYWVTAAKVPLLTQTGGLKLLFFWAKCLFWFALIAIVLGVASYVYLATHKQTGELPAPRPDVAFYVNGFPLKSRTELKTELTYITLPLPSNLVGSFLITISNSGNWPMDTPLISISGTENEKIEAPTWQPVVMSGTDWVPKGWSPATTNKNWASYIVGSHLQLIGVGDCFTCPPVYFHNIFGLTGFTLTCQAKNMNRESAFAAIHFKPGIDQPYMGY